MAGYRDDTNSLRGKPRPGRLTIIWPHQLGFTLGSGAIADSISDWYLTPTATPTPARELSHLRFRLRNRFFKIIVMEAVMFAAKIKASR